MRLVEMWRFIKPKPVRVSVSGRCEALSVLMEICPRLHSVAHRHCDLDLDAPRLALLRMHIGGWQFRGFIRAQLSATLRDSLNARNFASALAVLALLAAFIFIGLSAADLATGVATATATAAIDWLTYASYGTLPAFCAVYYLARTSDAELIRRLGQPVAYRISIYLTIAVAAWSFLIAHTLGAESWSALLPTGVLIFSTLCIAAGLFHGRLCRRVFVFVLRIDEDFPTNVMPPPDESVMLFCIKPQTPQDATSLRELDGGTASARPATWLLNHEPRFSINHKPEQSYIRKSVQSIICIAKATIESVVCRGDAFYAAGLKLLFPNSLRRTTASTTVRATTELRSHERAPRHPSLEFCPAITTKMWEVARFSLLEFLTRPRKQTPHDSKTSIDSGHESDEEPSDRPLYFTFKLHLTQFKVYAILLILALSASGHYAISKDIDQRTQLSNLTCTNQTANCNISCNCPIERPKDQKRFALASLAILWAAWAFYLRRRQLVEMRRWDNRIRLVSNEKFTPLRMFRFSSNRWEEIQRSSLFNSIPNFGISTSTAAHFMDAGMLVAYLELLHILYI